MFVSFIRKKLLLTKVTGKKFSFVYATRNKSKRLFRTYVGAEQFMSRQSNFSVESNSLKATYNETIELSNKIPRRITKYSNLAGAPFYCLQSKVFLYGKVCTFLL